MIWLAYFIFGSLVLRLMVSLTNLITKQWLRPARQKQHLPASLPLVSVLIPARNEAGNIGNLLSDLLNQEYSNLEILVYDDLSEDNTAGIVKKLARTSKKIRLIKGSPLPEGWLGKNHACHQLSVPAKGDYLLFLDADVRVKPSLIKNSLAHLQRHDLDLVSVFPKQEMVTFGEKITVPVMNWVLTGLLPLLLTRLSAWPSFSAANGQLMLFRAEVYHHHRFHEKVKNILVEDIEIFRVMKKMNLGTHTVLSNGDIACRMYDSWSKAIEGFSRNVIEFFGGHTLVAVLFALLTTLGFIPVLIALPLPVFIIFLFLLLLHRIIISFISRQPVIQNILLAPLQQISFCIMIIAALRNKVRHTLTWKDRSISVHTSKVSGAKTKLLLPAMLAIMLNLSAGPAPSQSPTPGELIYTAFVHNKMELWSEAIGILERQNMRSGSPDILYELILARYGFIGYNLGVGNESVAREQIALAEENIEKLAGIPRYESSAYSFQGAMYAYRISMARWRAVFWGQRSMNLVDKAIETDPANPSAWIEHGNAMFYAPVALGGSKEDAVKSYSRAISLMEKSMEDMHRWLYLNTLVSLAKSYQETGNRTMAINTYQKALDYEPDFKWVKEDLLPKMLKQ